MVAKEYVQLVTNIFNIIMFEMDRAESKADIASTYPKLVIMYEFFRLLRGEAFQGVRPLTPQTQNTFYKQESQIARKLDIIKRKINLNDEKVKYYIEEMEKPYLK